MVNNQCAGIYGKCLNIKITNYCPGNCYFCIEREGYKPSMTSVENIISKANELKEYQTVLILGFGRRAVYISILISTDEGTEKERSLYHN